VRHGRSSRPSHITHICSLDIPGPSPTYSHLSASDSQASPYNTAHGIPFYQPGPFVAAPPIHGKQYQPGPQFAYDGSEVSYPQAGPSGRLAPSAISHAGPSNAAPAPLLTTATLRSYDSTIPQYYPITTDPRRNERESSQKRKRVSNSPPRPNAQLETPKRSKSQDTGTGRTAKRYKLDEQASAQAQLPTPPATSRELGHEQLRAMSPELPPLPADTPIAPRRVGVVVTTHQDEGRKLGVVGMTTGDADQSALQPSPISPRTTSIPALTTDENGMAVIASHNALDSEIAWLEKGRKSGTPPSTDVPLPRTPAMTRETLTEEVETPVTKADKVSKRLQLFKEDEEEAVTSERMISTRIDMFGRVAVRSTTAAKFLGLDSSASLVEETYADDGEAWAESSSSVSTKNTLKPDWPDREGPWLMAGWRRKEKRRKEQQQRSQSIRRYLETSSDGDSDGDNESIASFSHARGRGKSVHRLGQLIRTQSRTKPFDTPGSDAKMALLNSIRYRPIAPLPIGRVACACGATAITGTAPLIECAGCRTWHHLQCNGIDDSTALAPQWWCPGCQAQAMSTMATPAHTTPRAYTQSDERSSAFKGDYTNIALAPSPMMFPNPSFSQVAAVTRTPMNRTHASPTSRQHRPRILSYGTDMWAYTEDGAPSSAAPSTPGPSRLERYSTPRIDDAPFDVTSTPSRHLDFAFGQPSLFGLTPLGGRGRVTSGVMLDTTPYGTRPRPTGGVVPMSEAIPSRHDFLRDLNKGPATEVPASPSSRWPHQLLGAHNLSPSPFGHRRTVSGNKMSSMRSSSKSGLGMGLPEDIEE